MALRQSAKTVFVCQQCGYQSVKWQGRCPECNQWNTLVEEIETGPSTAKTAISYYGEPQLLSEIKVDESIRIKTGIGEFDRILGGGIVCGSAILIGGSPGVGKSTLLLETASRISHKGTKVLYVSAEESIKQTKLRADRLGGSFKELYIVSETNLDGILSHIKKIKPSVVIVDSIQALYNPALSSSPGSVSQVRESASILTQLAKIAGVSIFLVGHITKDGSIAGPRVLEHIVDTVLYFEGEPRTNLRLLRAVKNRFGATWEVGVFEMSDKGLKEVKDPSEAFITERSKHASGSLIVSTLEGTRPMLVEIQALVTNASFGLPRRRVTGLDFNRVSFLVAVLEKRLALPLQNQDIFVNVAGGLKVLEPAADLGMALAIASNFKEIPTDPDTVVIGEVGLSGEVRSVSGLRARLSEADRMGFKQAIVPRYGINKSEFKGNIKLSTVATLEEAANIALKGVKR